MMFSSSAILGNMARGGEGKGGVNEGIRVC